MDARLYLARLSYDGAVEPDAGTLRALHLAHLRRVPFENLDIALGRRIRIDVGHCFAKVVGNRRGGFCYELNGLFGWLLRELGFSVTYLSAGVMRPDGSCGPEFDHLALWVRVPHASVLADEPGWLADVGFGDSFLEPLPLVSGPVNEQFGRSYRLDEQDGEFSLLRLDGSGEWRSQYRFTVRERDLRDFKRMSLFHQRSPQSAFTQHCTATIATEFGRVTLADGRLITTTGYAKIERPVADRREYGTLLARHFGIVLPDEDLARLIPPAS